MMNKISASIVGMLVASLLTVFGPSAAASPTATAVPVSSYAADVAVTTSMFAEFHRECGDRYRFGTDHINDGSSGNDDWYLRASVHYRFCKDRGDNSNFWFVVVQFSAVSYNQEGDHMGCDPITSGNVLEYVSFNPYFWDGHGRNFNPGPIRVPCASDTTGFKVQDYAHVPVIERRLWFNDGHAPRFKFNWHIEKNPNGPGLFEGSGTISGAMRHCSGKGYEPCAPF